MSAKKQEQEQPRNAADIFKRYLGQKVAVLCARYHYRGILSVVTEDAIVLANPTMVEVSGIAAAERPHSEDPMGSDVIVKNDAIEIMHQSNWVTSALPSEDGYVGTNTN